MLGLCFFDSCLSLAVAAQLSLAGAAHYAYLRLPGSRYMNKGDRPQLSAASIAWQEPTLALYCLYFYSSLMVFGLARSLVSGPRAVFLGQVLLEESILGLLALGLLALGLLALGLLCGVSHARAGSAGADFFTSV